MNRLIHPGRRVASFTLRRIKPNYLLRADLLFRHHRTNAVSSVLARSFSSKESQKPNEEEASHTKEEEQPEEQQASPETGDSTGEHADETPSDTIARLQQEVQTLTNALTDAKKEVASSLSRLSHPNMCPLA